MHTEKTVYKDIYDFAVGSRVRGTVVEFIPFGALRLKITIFDCRFYNLDTSNEISTPSRFMV